MSETEFYKDQLSNPDEVITRIRDSLGSIDRSLSDLFDFRLQVQRNNLMALVREAEGHIQKYEHIYPYIKDMCKDQTINPSLHPRIEKVLNWALKKGGNRNRTLSREIKQAWITYIVLLSCSMIDRIAGDKKAGNLISFTSGRERLRGLSDNN